MFLRVEPLMKPNRVYLELVEPPLLHDFRKGFFILSNFACQTK